MSQVEFPVPVHMKLGPIPVLSGFARYASVRQPTCASFVQRPAPCGQTQLGASSEPEVQRPAGTSCRSQSWPGARLQRVPVRP